jgi:hypothetical protein
MSTYIVVHDPDHDILSSQGERVCGRAKPCADDWLITRLHLEELLDPWIRIERLSWESSSPHSPARWRRAHLSTNKLLTLRTNTVGSDNNICLVRLAIISDTPSLASLLVLVVVDNLAVELNRHTMLLNSIHEHLVHERTHLKLARRRIRIKSHVSQTVCNLLGADHDIASVLERFDPAVVERDLLVLLEQIGPVLQESSRAQSHEVHVTCENV